MTEDDIRPTEPCDEPLLFMTYTYSDVNGTGRAVECGIDSREFCWERTDGGPWKPYYPTKSVKAVALAMTRPTEHTEPMDTPLDGAK